MKKSAILIADAGGTSIGWALLTHDTEYKPEFFSTQGMNILMASAEMLDELLAPVARWASEICGRDGLQIDDLYFYGAGCSTKESRKLASSRLVEFFPQASVHVDSDMLGAARSMLGDRRGLACILGTGSNSCLYDGKKIETKVPSLGYILGDEGSGAALGRRLLEMLLTHRMSINTYVTFFLDNPMTVETIIDKVYRRPHPNRFFASFAPWILDNIEEEDIRKMVVKEFESFIEYNIYSYLRTPDMPIVICGSIAANFEPLLREVAADCNVKISSIVADPMEGLIRYHQTHRID